MGFDSSGLPSTDVTWAARSEAPEGKTSPEELIAAAHSACFSMALSAGLAKAGHDPQNIRTSATVSFDPAQGGITGVRLSVRAAVPGMSAEDFAAAASDAKSGCPVSKALSAVDITLDAALEQT